jgi:uncharacterized protein (TIGR00369 family)
MERTRTFSWEDPLIGAKEALHMKGIDYLKAMFEGRLPVPPILNTMNFKMKSIEEGKAVFGFTAEEYHYNPIGTVHGGVISTLLDSAMGCTVHSILPAGKGYTTLELKVNFLRAITKDSGELFSEGKMIHTGNKTALVEAQITDAQGKVYAHSVSTCLIIG